MIASEDPIQDVPMAFSLSSWVATPSQHICLRQLASDVFTGIEQAGDHADATILNFCRLRILFIVDEIF
jgi:hypothetical protein